VEQEVGEGQGEEFGDLADRPVGADLAEALRVEAHGNSFLRAGFARTRSPARRAGWVP